MAHPTRALVVHKEECSVTAVIHFGNPDGPTKISAKLIPVVPGLRRTDGKCSLGVCGRAAIVLEEHTVKIVAARFGDVVDHATNGVSERRRKAARLNLKFLDRSGRRKSFDRSVSQIGHADPVHEVFVEASDIGPNATIDVIGRGDTRTVAGLAGSRGATISSRNSGSECCQSKRAS